MRNSLSRQTIRRTLCAALACVVMPMALAWTNKPVRILVPAPAGGTMDVFARLIADQLAIEIGQPVVVDNKPGAGGAIAVQAMRAAAPDGQTLMITASNVLTEIPHVMKTNFDPLKDVRPVAIVARAGMVLVGSPNLPAKDLKGLISYLKANPGKFSFASYSTGTSSQYAGMIFNQKAGLDLQHVPFPGSPPALTQVIGGQIPIMFDGIVTSKSMIASGHLHAYGVAAKTRSPQLPDVPTMAEQGYPDINFSNWLGVVATFNVPNDLIEKIHATVARVAAQPKVKERMMANGFDPADDQPPAQLAQAVRDEYTRNAAIVKAFHIQFNQ